MMKQNVKTIKADLTKHDFIYLVPLSDFHIEEPQTDVGAIKGYVKWIKDHKNAYTLLNGDLFSVITKKSAADIYEMGEPGGDIEFMSIDKALDVLTEILKPIANRILAACAGGHELKNLFRYAGSDYVYRLMKQLGKEQVYTRDGGILKIRTKPLNKNDNTCFSAIYTHGWGGARTRGAKIRKAEYLAEAAEVDMVIISHDHTQNIGRANRLKPGDWDEDLSIHRAMLVSTGGFRGYAGYPLRAGYQPADLGTPRIRLAKKVDENGIIRNDIHASI